MTTDSSTADDAKATLHRYLQDARDALAWKAEGLTERELRLPRTPTGTNILGLVKHMGNIEAGYFGETFGRELPASPLLVDFEVADADPLADLYATAEESAEDVLGFYRQIQAFADETIAERSLEDTGTVPWWDEGANPVTLHRMLVHVIAETSRHAGHADILREGIDGGTGLRRDGTNMPDGTDWGAHVAMLTGIAEGF